MEEAQDELWRDFLVALRHWRFIAALLALALIVAVGTGLATNTESRAISEAEIEITTKAPLSGQGESLPTLDTFAELAAGERVAEAAARRLGEDQSTITDNTTVRVEEKIPTDRNSVDRIFIEATGESQREASAISVAVMDAFVEAAEGVASDPEGLKFLEEQQAFALEELRGADLGGLFELSQVRVDVASQRALLSSQKDQLVAIDSALALIEAEKTRPLGELLVAVQGVLGRSPQEGSLNQVTSVGELERGLQLRRQLVNTFIRTTEEETQRLSILEQELSRSTASEGVAISLHGRAVTDLEAAMLAEQLTGTTVTVTQQGVDTSGDVDWLARLSAAAAFGLVVGVAGAFALEFLTPHWQRWRRRDKAPQPEEL